MTRSRAPPRSLFEPVGAGTTVTVVNERESTRAESITVVGTLAGWILGQHDERVLRKLKTVMERDHRT